MLPYWTLQFKRPPPPPPPSRRWKIQRPSRARVKCQDQVVGCRHASSLCVNTTYSCNAIFREIIDYVVVAGVLQIWSVNNASARILCAVRRDLNLQLHAPPAGLIPYSVREVCSTQGSLSFLVILKFHLQSTIS